MIPPAIRQRLATALLDLPIVENAGGRTTLLAGIPSTGFNRDNNNAAIDLDLLIIQLEENFGAHGEWRLLELLDNATGKAAGVELGKTLQNIRVELEQFLGEIRKKRVNFAELAQPHLFDLRIPVRQCLNALSDEACMCGFVLPTPTARLLQYFCNSLKHRAVQDEKWTRDQVLVAVPLQIQLPHTSVDDAFKRASRYKPRLNDKVVVWAAYVHDSADAQTLWLNLQREFGAKLNNHFVVVFGMSAKVPCPAGLSPLSPPKFTPKDVSDWVLPIVKSLAWQEATLPERWVRAIVADLDKSEDGLPIEELYDKLEFHRNLLGQYQTEKAFQERLELEANGD